MRRIQTLRADLFLTLQTEQYEVLLVTFTNRDWLLDLFLVDLRLMNRQLRDYVKIVVHILLLHMLAHSEIYLVNIHEVWVRDIGVVGDHGLGFDHVVTLLL